MKQLALTVYELNWHEQGRKCKERAEIQRHMVTSLKLIIFRSCNLLTKKCIKTETARAEIIGFAH